MINTYGVKNGIVYTEAFEIFEAITARVNTAWTNSAGPFFYFGYWKEIASTLMAKKQTAYSLPAIILHADYKSEDGETYLHKSDIRPTIYIVVETNPKWSSSDRIAQNYEGKLRPLYNLLISEVKRSHSFDLWSSGKEQMKHTYTELLYMGTEGKEQNKLNDFIDAIEIKFDGLKIRDFNKLLKDL